MKKRKISTAAFLAGVTTLAVSLPAMAEIQTQQPKSSHASQLDAKDYVNGEDFEWMIDKNDM